MLDSGADVEYRECFTDRTLLIVVLPSLDACVRAQPKLCAPAAPALLACAARLDARAFRKSIQPILERFLVDAAGPQAVLAVVEHATLLLDRADASWAAKRVVDALARALRDDAGPRLRDAALRQLASSDVLDAVIAKASIAARNGVSSRVSTDLVPAVCRCVASKTCALATRVTAHKALAAALDRPPATPPEVLMRVVLPALRDSVRLVHGQPALAMCVLGCFDLVAKRLPEQSRILRDVLPSLIPLLDEKALNARQFDMVAGRVEAMLASAIQARRGELDSPSSVQPRLSAPDPFRATPSPPAAAPAPVPRAPSPAADVYRGAGSSHASDYNFGAGAMPGDPLALTSASHARAPAVPIPKLPKPPAPAPRRRGPPARGPPKQQDAVWRPPGSSNGGVAKLTAQLAAEDPFAAGNDPFASSGGTSPAFGGGAASVDPFAAVGLSSGDPFAGMGGATNAPMPSMAACRRRRPAPTRSPACRRRRRPAPPTLRTSLGLLFKSESRASSHQAAGGQHPSMTCSSSRGPTLDVTVLESGGPWGGRQRASAGSSAAGAGRFFHNSVPPSEQNRVGKPPEQCARSPVQEDSRRRCGDTRRLGFARAGLLLDFISAKTSHW